MMSLDSNTLGTKNIKNRNFFLSGRFLLQVLFSLSIFFTFSSNSFAATSVGVSSKPALTNGLVGHWTFDGKNMTNATATDISGNGNNGTLTNMTQATAKTPGKIGQGLKFDGVDDYVSIANNANLNGSQGTWLFWVKKGGTPSGNGYVSLGKTDVIGSYNGMNFYHFSSNIGLQIKGASDVGSYATNIGSLADSKWHHVAVSYISGGALRIYFDGSLVVSTTSPTFTISSQNLRIGRSVDTYWETYNGNIDDLRIYNRALSVSEIQALYKAGGGTPVAESQTSIKQNTGTNSGLVGHWTFDGQNMTSATATDVSGIGNNGILINMTRATSSVLGKIGQGLLFNGSNQYINIATTSFTGVFTFSVWVKVNGSQTSTIFGEDSGTSGGGPKIGVSGNTFLVRVVSGGSGFASTLPYSTWHHLVVSRDSLDNVSVIVDGINVGGQSAQTGTYTLTRIAGNGGAVDQLFNGSLDDVRIYNRALSTTEIQALYKAGGGSVTAVSSTNNNRTGINAGLVGHWTFDGKNMTSATALDSSGNGRTGTLTNMTQASSKVIGKMGQGLRFDGTDDYISIPYTGIDYERTQPITISAWVKLNNVAPVGGFQTIFGRLYSAGTKGTFLGWCKTSVALVCNNNSFSFFLGSNANASGVSVMTTTNSFLPGVWTHVVVTYSGNSDASGIKIYKNGVSMSLTTNFNTLASSITGTTNWRIGDDGTSDYSSGTIDDVRFYNRELSAKEVQALYKLGTQ